MEPSPFGMAAPLWAPNWNVLALRGKRPVERGWSRWCCERQPLGYIDEFVHQRLQYNIGLPLWQRSLIAIDIDTDEPEHIACIVACLPEIWAAKRGKRGFTAFFLASDHNLPTQRLGLVEIPSHGTQTVIPPSIHPDTRQPYVWLDPHGLEA